MWGSQSLVGAAGILWHKTEKCVEDFVQDDLEQNGNARSIGATQECIVVVVGVSMAVEWYVRIGMLQRRYKVMHRHTPTS